MNADLIEEGVKLILQGLSCDLNDHNFQDTPARVAKCYRQMFASSEKGWNDFVETYNDLILLRGHELWTLCPHHLLPVCMKVYIAYKPVGRVIGLSKLARVLQEVNSGPLLQERFTFEAAKLLGDLTGAKDVACLVVGEHGCMRIRGVKTDGDVVTQTYFGCFNEPALQTQFMNLVGLGRHL